MKYRLLLRDILKLILLPITIILLCLWYIVGILSIITLFIWDDDFDKKLMVKFYFNDFKFIIPFYRRPN